jgi:hypothetical protein
VDRLVERYQRARQSKFQARVVLRQESCGCSARAKRVMHRLFHHLELFPSKAPVYTFVAMPLSARKPVIEFRFLLSAPIRLPLRALQSLHRPQCLPIRPTDRSSQCLAQRRSLCLYKTARAETVLGQHKLLPFDRYEVPPLDNSEHLVNIGKGEDAIATDVSLQEVYDKHLKPGQIIYLLDDIPKSTAESVDKLHTADVTKRNRTFGVFQAGSLPHNIKTLGKGKGPGALRVSPLKLSSPADYFKLVMDRSYQFIEQGSPVEFSIRFRSGHVNKEEQLVPSETDSWRWIHCHFPHVRPDFILRSMPEGSRFVVDPVSNGTVLQFVIAANVPKGPRIPDNLTRRLFRVKDSVKLSIARGQQAQLPKHFRSQLEEAGNKAYSRVSGMPIKANANPEAAEEPLETEDALSRLSSSPDRYLPEVPAKRLPLRDDKLSKGGYLMPPRPGKVYAKDKFKKEKSLRGKVKKVRSSSNFIDGNPFEI